MYNQNHLDIRLGKTYLPEQIIEKVNRYPKLDVRFGHILMENKDEKKHEYFVNKNFIKSLNSMTVKILSITLIQNFATRLLDIEEIIDILRKIEENNNLCCIIDENDLEKIDYNYKSFNRLIISLNKTFKANDMPYLSLKHPKGIVIKYRRRN